LSHYASNGVSKVFAYLYLKYPKVPRPMTAIIANMINKIPHHLSPSLLDDDGVGGVGGLS